MMLQALCAYAERERLVEDPDFEKRPVHYELALSKDGRFLGLVTLGEGKQHRTLSGLPLSPSSRNNPGNPSFVVDNANYMLGIPKAGGNANLRLSNAQRCAASFRELVQAAATATTDPGLVGLLRFLDSAEQVSIADAALAHAEEKKSEGRANKVLVPRVGEHLVHERAGVRTWWKELRTAARRGEEEGDRALCLITGRMCAVATTHPPLKGPPFPGTGAKLVAFDKAPFESHGLTQGQNAPVSERAAQLYTTALNHLLERTSTGRRRGAINLDTETVSVCWTRDQSDAPELILSLFDPIATNSEATEALRAVWKGAERKSYDPTAFYVVTLSVNSARVVVRDWIETTAADIKNNVGRWFEDLKVQEGETEPVPLRALLNALQAVPDAGGDKRGLPPQLSARVFRAAVYGGALPRSLLLAAVQRLRVPPQNKKDNDFVLRARVGLIKAVLRRQTPSLEVTVALDESNIQPAYLLGRLFAALEKLQLVASGRGNDLNATVRDRYYGAASSTPGAVFGRLLALSMHHASKARDNGMGVTAEKAKASIMNALPAAPLPKTLDLEQQGVFAIGYYHQREAFFRKKETA
jgi:CRISPR-associated protein Csd1